MYTGVNGDIGTPEALGHTLTIGNETISIRAKQHFKLYKIG